MIKLTPLTNNYKQNNINHTPSFKGVKKPGTFISLTARSMVAASKKDNAYNWFIDNIIAQKILKPIVNSKVADKLIDKSAKVDDMTSYMTTAGAVITTSVYAGSTLHNKNLNKTKEDKKAARTLALNQGLVTVLSTLGAFTINKSISNFTENLSYKFRDANQTLKPKTLEKRMRGFSTAQKLLTFTLMYRYVAPVLVTPIASKIGKALNNNKPVANNAKTATVVQTPKAPVKKA